MTTYEFTFVLDHAPSGAEQDQLFEAGCDDAVVTFNERDDTGHIRFDREAGSLTEAISTALHDVEKAGLRVIGVVSDDLVTVKEIAARTGRTYESIRLLASGRRGPGGFPRPVTSGGYAFYSWAEVARWWIDNIDPGVEEPSEYDRVIAAADHVVRARALLKGRAEQLAGLLAS